MKDRPSNQPEDNYPDKELADLWKRQETPMAHTADSDELAKLAASIKAGHRAEQQALLRLNIREVIPAALLCVFFAYLGTVEEAAWVLFSSSLLCLGVAAVLIRSSVRQHQAEKQLDTGLRGSIQRSLSQARHRFTMYHSAGWWYAAPLAVAFGIFYGWAIYDDPNGAKPGDAVVIAMMLAVLAVLVWWNRRVAFTKWQPEVERFEALLAELDDEPNEHPG